MDIHQGRTEAIQEEMKAKVNKNQEKLDDWPGEMKAWQKHNGLPRSNGGLSRKGKGKPREDEGQPVRNGGRGGCL
jgi:hypothetical protein